MAVLEEESSSSSSSSSNYKSRSASGPHYLAKSVLRGTVVLQVLPGHFRSPSSNDVVFGKVKKGLRHSIVYFFFLQMMKDSQLNYAIKKDEIERVAKAQSLRRNLL